jgi:hypothetical protein
MIEPSRPVRIEPYQPAAKKTWDAFIRAGKNGNFLFLRDYMDYHSDRFADHSLLFFRESKLLGCLPAHQADDTLYSHQGLTFGGLVIGSGRHLVDVLAMFASLRAYMKQHGLRRLVYRAMPYPYHRLPADEDIFALYRFGARVIDVKATAALRMGSAPAMDDGRRRNINKAKAGGLVVARDWDFGGFMNLCTQALGERHRARPTHTAAEMERLSAAFPDNIQLYTARSGSDLLAGSIFFVNPTCWRGQYAADSEPGRKSAAMSAVYHYLFEKVWTPGMWYDFGHSMDPQTGALNEGLFMFKESLGARTIAQLTYCMDVE